MRKIERRIRQLGRCKFPKGIDLTLLKKQPRVTGSRGLSVSGEFSDVWFVFENDEKAIYKTYDNLSLTNRNNKFIKKIRIYNELLCAKLCDIMGVGHAKYERAYYNDTNGLISYNVLGDRESMTSIINNTSHLGDFIDYLKEKEKLNDEQIRLIVHKLYTYMLFDIRTLQTDRNRNNVPLARDNITGELRVTELLDCEYAYLANNMIAGNYGGDNFFGVYDKKSPVEVENIINAYNDKMSYGSYYTLCVYKCLDERTIDNRIEECCSLAAMSPEFNSILKHFMESFDLERAISELEDEGVVPSKGYKEYILAIDKYIKERFEYHIERMQDSSKKYTESVPLDYRSLADRVEIMHMLSMARSGSKNISDSIEESYREFYYNVNHHYPLK